MDPSIEPQTGPASGRRLNRRQVLQALGLGAVGTLPIAGAGAARQDLTVAPPTTEATQPAATLPTVADKAAELAYDLEKIFRFVADEVHYESYVGALRGSRGALWGRAGNSVNQAILLARLLDEAFVTYRYAIGELTEDGAAKLGDALRVDFATAAARHERLFELATGVDLSAAPAPVASSEDQQLLNRLTTTVEDAAALTGQLVADGTALLAEALSAAGIELPDPGEVVLPDAERLRHVWIQYADGPLWIDLDPTIPGAQPGETLATVAETVAELPADLDHLVRIKVVAEEVRSGRPTRRDVVAHEAPSWALLGQPVEVLFTAPGDFEGLGLTINQLFTSQATFVPTILAGLDGTYADVGIALGAGGEEGGLLDELGGPESEGPLDGETLALWLQVEITSPGTGPVLVERAIFDRIGAAVRLAGEPDMSAVTPIELAQGPDGRAIYPPLTGTVLLDVAATRLPVAYALNDPIGQELYSGTNLLGPSFTALRDGLALREGQRAGWWTYPDQPNVTAFIVNSDDPSSDRPPLTITADLLHRSLAWAPLAEAAGGEVHPGLLFGVVDQVAERMLLDPAVVGPDADTAKVRPGPNVGRLFAEAVAQGIAIRVMQPDQAAELDDLPLSPEAKTLIGAALAAGSIVVVPAEPVAFAGEALSGWWEIDPITGRTLDRLETGRAGASAVIAAGPLVDYIINTLKTIKKYKDQFNCLGNVIGLVAALMALWVVLPDKEKGAVASVATLGQMYRTGAACSALV